MTMVAILLLTSAFPTLGTTPSTLTQAPAPVAGQDQAARELVDLLWSSDQAQRRAAERQLLKLGAAAIPPLISLLQDIYTYPRKARFPIGREDEARQALGHYQDYPPEDLYDLEITGRLRDDAAGLLGQFHAVEAVPILIAVLHRQVEASFPRGLNRVMRSLAQIGAPAVPALIEEIENAVSKAPSLVFRDDDTPSESGGRRSFDEKNNQWDGSREVAIIRIRAALILGEIGDERALPVLEGLLHQTSKPLPLEIESAWVAHAIDRIREKSRSRQ
jgi:HEAT repeat protein